MSVTFQVLREDMRVSEGEPTIVYFTACPGQWVRDVMRLQKNAKDKHPTAPATDLAGHTKT